MLLGATNYMYKFNFFNFKMLKSVIDLPRSRPLITGGHAWSPLHLLDGRAQVAKIQWHQRGYVTTTRRCASTTEYW